MTLLQTNLKEIESKSELENLIRENKNVMVCCGRMGPMCIPVYEVMEELQDEYEHTTFVTMAFDNPESSVIRNAPMCQGFMGLPYTVYYKNGEMVKATSSIQSMEQVKSILDENFGK